MAQSITFIINISLIWAMVSCANTMNKTNRSLQSIDEAVHGDIKDNADLFWEVKKLFTEKEGLPFSDYLPKRDGSIVLNGKCIYEREHNRRYLSEKQRINLKNMTKKGKITTFSMIYIVPPAPLYYNFTSYGGRVWDISNMFTKESIEESYNHGSVLSSRTSRNANKESIQSTFKWVQTVHDNIFLIEEREMKRSLRIASYEEWRRNFWGRFVSEIKKLESPITIKKTTRYYCYYPLAEKRLPIL
ncbi:MAG: hypothetical protein OXB88_01415 [Bacteriovoracales bacterium]|nr:hypothetical protein [Bacteriovoracales bacterium]